MLFVAAAPAWAAGSDVVGANLPWLALILMAARLFAPLAQKLLPVNARHHQVGQHHGKGAFLLQLFHRHLAVDSRFDGVALPFQGKGHHV